MDLNGFGLRAGGHFEAQNCQHAIKFISCNNLQITTNRPLAFSPCYQLWVLVCSWFEIIFQFSHSLYSVLKDLVFLEAAKLALVDRQGLWQVLVERLHVLPDIELGCVGWKLLTPNFNFINVITVVCWNVSEINPNCMITWQYILSFK